MQAIADAKERELAKLDAARAEAKKVAAELAAKS